MKPMAIERASTVGRSFLTVSIVVSDDSPPLYMFMAVTAIRPGIEQTIRIVPKPLNTLSAAVPTAPTGPSFGYGESMNAPGPIIRAPAAEPRYVHQNTVLVFVPAGRYREF